MFFFLRLVLKEKSLKHLTLGELESQSFHPDMQSLPQGYKYPKDRIICLIKIWQNFPGVPVAKTPHSQCKGPRFDPRLETRSQILYTAMKIEDLVCHN